VVDQDVWTGALLPTEREQNWEERTGLESRKNPVNQRWRALEMRTLITNDMEREH
jgi:hypothetical protein